MSVSKRADTGRWRARYRGPDGKQRSKDFDTKAAATTWANEQDRRVRRNEWTDPDAGHATVEQVQGGLHAPPHPGATVWDITVK